MCRRLSGRLASLGVRPVFRVSKVKPVKDSPSSGAVNADLVHAVHQLLGSQRAGRGVHYRTDWEGYGPADHQWISECHILDKDLISLFHGDRPNQPPHVSGSRTCLDFLCVLLIVVFWLAVHLLDAPPPPCRFPWIWHSFLDFSYYFI